MVLKVSDSTLSGPFERASRQTPDIRSFKAFVQSEAGTLLEEMLLCLPSETLENSSGAEMERRWKGLRQRLRKAREGMAEDAFLELVLPGDDDPGLIPPLVYCKLPARFFSLPCPLCFAPLETCRDDNFLAGAGLPLYSTSRERILVCPDCMSRLSRPTVIDPRGTSTLHADGALILNAAEYFQELATELQGEHVSPEAGRFECGHCPERRQCWGWEDGGEVVLEMKGLEIVSSASEGPQWQVLTTHTVPYLLLRPDTVSFESFLYLLGSGQARKEAGEDSRLLFSFDDSGLDAVEILTLRLIAFYRAVRSVREYHRLFGEAHLDINTESLLCRPGRPVAGLPSLWNFDIRLDPGLPRSSIIPAEGQSFRLPPDEPKAPFFSQSLRDFLLTGRRSGELKINRFIREKESENLWRIEGQLLDPGGIFPIPRSEDWIEIRCPEDPYGLGLDGLFARVDPRKNARKGKGFMSILSETLPLREESTERIGKIGGARLPNVYYRVYPSFGPADDLYSLGMLLFQCLLVNDEQDLGSVADDLALMNLRDLDPDRIRAIGKQQISRQPGSWGPPAVFFDAIDRSAQRANSIPEDVWLAVITLALRMVASPSDFLAGNENGENVFRRVESEASLIVESLKSFLFNRQALNMEMQNILARLMEEFGGSNPGR